MKRMVELPSGVWIDLDSIEAVEPQDEDHSQIIMGSGRVFFVWNTTPVDVIKSLQFEWPAWREGGN